MTRVKGLNRRLHLLQPREVLHAEDDLYDGGGLVMRVNRSGSAAWCLQYSNAAGQRRELGLGPVDRGSLQQSGESLVQARQAAREARDQVLLGKDPVAMRAAQRVAARSELEATQRAALAARAAAEAETATKFWTLARCARDYHERIIEPKRSTKHGLQWIASLENHVPASLWHKPIVDITGPQLLDALVSIRPHERARNVTPDKRLQETVGRVRQRLEVVFDDAMFRGRCTSNPATTVRRRLVEAMPKRERRNFRALHYREAPALMRRLREAPGTAARCLEFTVLTASRTSEALMAEWSEFDFVDCVWTVPASRMKAGELITVVN